MDTTKPRHLLRIEYEEAAEAYLRSLPPEHFMEATPQATQREITLESLALVKARRPEVQVFNELLVQYPLPDEPRPHQVVPDNMVVMWPEPIKAIGSFDLPLQPTRPLWVLEYVSKASKRKDYEESFHKYEQELQVPYYLIFYPDAQDLTLYQLSKGRYMSVKPNEAGRYAIKEMELEIGLLEDWVRYWFQGELLPLPAELQRDLDDTRQQLKEATQLAQTEKLRADEEKLHANQEKLRADKEKLRADEEKLRADEEKLRAGEETRRADKEKVRADEEARRASEFSNRADEEMRRAEEEAKLKEREQQGRLLAEQKNRELLAQLEQLRAQLDL